MTREEMFKDIESITVGLDDTFLFHCTQCGKCCKNRTDIMLSPMDIFRIAKELNMSNFEFFQKYCTSHIGDNSRLPIIMLKPVGLDNRCPLLKSNKCSVHNVKPAVCGMFPLGRYIAFPNGESAIQPLDQGAVKYLLQPLDCGDKSETHTVREWLSGFDIALEDNAFLLWNQSLCQISQILQDLEKKWDMMTMMVIWFATRVTLYENYNHNRPFLPQLEANVEALKSLLADIPKLKGMVNRGTGRA